MSLIEGDRQRAQAVNVKTRPFDAAEYLDSPEAISAFLADAFASNDIAEIADALGIAARRAACRVWPRKPGLTANNSTELYRSGAVRN